MDSLVKSPAATSPCAACKLLRRRCAENCTFAPFFPADEPLKFASVHRVFGASNVNKMLQDLPMDQRGDAVSSMVYEANARIRDPVYGCVAAIANLQHQVVQLQTQLAVSQAQSVYAQMQYETLISSINNNGNFINNAPTPAGDATFANSNNNDMGPSTTTSTTTTTSDTSKLDSIDVDPSERLHSCIDDPHINNADDDGEDDQCHGDNHIHSQEPLRMDDIELRVGTSPVLSSTIRSLQRQNSAREPLYSN